jgi:hypothetical protein
MDAGKLVKDKNFVGHILNKIPYYLKSQMTKSDIMSELGLVLVLCSKSFDPKKGSLVNFVSRSLQNNLISKLNREADIRRKEVPLEWASGHVYEENKDETAPLLAYFKELPVDLLDRLSQFALGKIKKEDIYGPPLRLTSEEVSRIIEKIDSMV